MGMMDWCPDSPCPDEEGDLGQDSSPRPPVESGCKRANGSGSGDPREAGDPALPVWPQLGGRLKA